MGRPKAQAFYPPLHPPLSPLKESLRIQADNLQAMVYANLQLPDGTARRSPGGWWSLTPPSHPYPYGRLFSSADTCCHQQLLFSEVGCPLLPGLSSRQRRTNIYKDDAREDQRQTGALLSRCKITKLFHQTNVKNRLSLANIF